MPRPIHRLLTAVTGLVLSASALAHSSTDAHVHSAFLGGLLHPFTGLDHLCAMLAVGMWSAVMARRAGRELLWGPLAFATLMLAGAVLGLQGVQVPAVEPMIAASLVACGPAGARGLSARRQSSASPPCWWCATDSRSPSAGRAPH